MTLLQQNRLPEAIPSFSAVVRLQPASAAARLDLGSTLAAVGQAGPAAGQLREALRLDPAMSDAANLLAWILATAEDGNIRNGREARQLAERLCAPPRPPNPLYLRTLAAAEAEAGLFPKATELARQAAQAAQHDGQLVQARELEAQADRYAQGHPCRQSVFVMR
jgi:tetratricopeptide (TPR) repeat protein